MLEINFEIDGVKVKGWTGQTIMDAADDAGIYIPRLCDTEDLKPAGSCRVCTVKVNGKPAAACTQPISEGIVVENNTEEMNQYRVDLVEMLFSEGNHLCPVCEASGDCELQAMGYRLGMTYYHHPDLNPNRTIDASHPDILIDSNRCIFCGRCIRASRELDGKNIFSYVGRGINKRIKARREKLADTDADLSDKVFAYDLCPVGCIIRKREGFKKPIGTRYYDHKPIGSDIQS
ncbi:MAG: (2Fe-2S)-binding protein [SAR324 cluster bacterium]|nr:(2Fe-2S)-binding protein [SAR324 cluster bacterium]